MSDWLLHKVPGNSWISGPIQEIIKNKTITQFKVNKKKGQCYQHKTKTKSESSLIFFRIVQIDV